MTKDEKNREAGPKRRTALGRNPALESESELRYLLVLWRRRYLIVFCILAFIALGVFQIKRAQPVYTSEALLKFEPATSQIVDFGERSSLIYQRDEIRTAVQLIRSPSIARRVLEALGKGQVAESAPDESPLGNLRTLVNEVKSRIREAIVSYEPPNMDIPELRDQNEARDLLRSVYVTHRPDTKLIEIHVSRQDQEEARRICEEFCIQFINQVESEKRESFVYAREYLTRQLEDTKVRLAAAEQEVYDFSGQSDIRLMEESRELAIRNLTEIRSSLEQQRVTVSTLEKELAQAESEARQELVIRSGDILGTLVAERDRLLAERSMMEAENQEDFRPLNRVRQQLELIDGQMEDKRAEYVSAFVERRELDLDAAVSLQETLEKRLKQQEAELADLEREMITFRVLQREVDATRQVFNTLLDQINRLEVLDDVSPGNVTVVTPASIPTAPSSPNVTRTFMLFSLFGAGFGVCLVLFLQWIDRSARSPEVVEATLGVPSLAVLPFIRKGGSKLSLGKKPTAGVLAVGENISYRNAEAFRYLRTSISYSITDREKKLLLVTSPRPREGKSTVASNLAYFNAEHGLRTLLIDADLKRPSIHRVMDVARQPGLTDVVTSQASAEDAIIQQKWNNLDILPAGFSSPSPVSLLESRAMRELLGKLRQDYDTIVIDSPPAEGMADALVLAAQADGVVVVVQQGVTPLESLGRVCQKLESVGGTILGVVYNNSRPTRLGEPEGYNYSYYAQHKEA